MLHELRQRPVELLLLPFATIGLAAIFWLAQLIQYRHSIQGVLYGWIIAGIFFIAIQISLIPGAWKDAGERPMSERLRARWLIGSQLLLFIGISIYNFVALAALASQHAHFVIFDALIAAAAAIIIVPALIRYRRSPEIPRARAMYATGLKASPQYVQAVALAAGGAGGIAVISMASMTSLGALRYILARQAHRRAMSSYSQATHTIALRDFISIICMAAGWVIGTILA
jgi:hypothetical protein